MKINNNNSLTTAELFQFEKKLKPFVKNEKYYANKINWQIIFITGTFIILGIMYILKQRKNQNRLMERISELEKVNSATQILIKNLSKIHSSEELEKSVIP